MLVIVCMHCLSVAETKKQNGAQETETEQSTSGEPCQAGHRGRAADGTGAVGGTIAVARRTGSVGEMSK